MMEANRQWDEAMVETVPASCGRLDMASYTGDGVAVRYIYWEDYAERTEVRGNRCDHVAYMAARYHDLRARVAELEAALSGVMGPGRCCCGVSIGDSRLGGRHSAACLRAQAVLAGEEHKP